MRTRSIYNDMFDKQVIVECYRGSIAHGLYINPKEKEGTDDIDTVVVYRYPEQYYLTLSGYYRSKEVYEKQIEEYDEVGYEIRKFFHLLSQQSPNILHTLWLRERDYIKTTPEWEMIIENRNVFLGKKRLRDAYVGYSYSQLKRMLANSFEGYRGRLGEKRKELVKEFGYDTKHASHLIRLLRMAIEFLRDGKPIVYRVKDANELIDIKKGKRSLAEIRQEADRLFKEIEKVYEKSELPEENNKYEINKLLYEVMVYTQKQ